MCCTIPLHLMPLVHDLREGRSDAAPNTLRQRWQNEDAAPASVLAFSLKALIVAAAVALGLGAPVWLGIAVQAAEAQVLAPAGGFATIDTGQLATMLADKTFTFVNVHIPYEGEIDGTDANIAFDTIADNLDKLPADKGAEIVLYCRSGRMSEIAAGTLSGLGYANVSHVAGGMVAWQKDGGEIVFK